MCEADNIRRPGGNFLSQPPEETSFVYFKPFIQFIVRPKETDSVMMAVMSYCMIMIMEIVAWTTSMNIFALNASAKRIKQDIQ